MKLKKIIPFICALLFLLAIPVTGTDFKIGETYNGFKLVEKRLVKEVNAECLYFFHERSGARLFKILADDDNKTFAISFKTDPESNCGTPHIIEHSVLNGSKSFPVKSPYDILSKGSLLTFINAFTGEDLTCFPVASKNNKDYFNLMHVYLDAVFQPMFKTEPRILKQEGWHCEMESTDGPISYKGVVYNEMKGVYSDPKSELTYQINRNLFPDNGYRFSSGGYPEDIPKLTQEMFVNYHNKYYHPSNSYILLYGNADLNKELAFIDKEYLSKYEKSIPPSVFPFQKPFESMKRISFPYAVSAGTDLKDQTYLSFSVIIGLNTDRALVMGLETICDVLVNQEAAPIRLALQRAGIGKDVSASVDGKNQNVLQIIVLNANPKDKENFLNIVLNGLKEASEKGLDKKAVAGILNRVEFQLREGNNSQKGLNYTFQIIPGWFFGNDPYLTLEYEKPLAIVKTSLNSDYLERIIKEKIVNNPHALLLTLEPKAGLDKELNAKVESELNNFKSSLNDEKKIRLINDTKDLIAYQKREDSPEELATVPLLEREDINPVTEWYPLSEKKIANIPVLNYNTFTNNVVYARLVFDLRVLPENLLPYATILTEVLGNQNTSQHSFGDLDNQINMNTGGFNSYLNTYNENQKDNNLIPKFVVSSKAMNNKIDKMIDLIFEIITGTKYDSAERLKTILAKFYARVEYAVKVDGYNCAQKRTLSYFSYTGMFSEKIAGLDFYWFLRDLINNYDQKADEIKSNLIKTASLLFDRNNLTLAVVCDNADYRQFEKSIISHIEKIPAGKPSFIKWNFEPVNKREGLQTSSKVQYVIKGYNLKKLGFEWSGKLRVLNQIISKDWLHNRIRVVGGAYGGLSSVDALGNFLFKSYRDPNLKLTLDNYDAIPEYLDKVEFTEKDMTRYIIGTIASMDSPLTSPQKGDAAIANHFNKVTEKYLQETRDAVLNTTVSDIKGFNRMIKAILGKNSFCVYGNDEKIELEKDLFGKIEKITK